MDDSRTDRKICLKRSKLFLSISQLNTRRLDRTFASAWLPLWVQDILDPTGGRQPVRDIKITRQKSTLAPKSFDRVGPRSVDKIFSITFFSVSLVRDCSHLWETNGFHLLLITSLSILSSKMQDGRWLDMQVRCSYCRACGFSGDQVQFFMTTSLEIPDATEFRSSYRARSSSQIIKPS
jgi:hypothetical protein